MSELAPAQRMSSPGVAPPETAPVAAPRRKSLVRELAETLLLTAVLFVIARGTIQPFRVDGHSMDPSLHNGEFMLVDKVSYHLGQPQRGDIVVFKPPFETPDDYVKRVIALPGDVVKVHGGTVYVNNRPLAEPYLGPGNRPQYDFAPYKVPPHVLFVLGDNRNSSYDSHLWGLATPLDEKLVIGRALVAYWPLQYFQVFGHPAYASASAK